MEHVPCLFIFIYMYKCFVFNGDNFNEFRSNDQIYEKPATREREIGFGKLDEFF